MADGWTQEQSGTRREALVREIARYWRRHRYGPSLKELCEEAGIPSTSMVSYHLRELKRLGLVYFDAGVPRSVGLTALGWERSGLTPFCCLVEAARGAPEDMEEASELADVR